VPPGNLATNPTPLTNPLIPAGHIATDDEPPVVIGVVVDHLLKVYTFDDMIFIFPRSHRVKVRFVAASPRWEVASERGTTGWRQMAAETREGDSSGDREGDGGGDPRCDGGDEREEVETGLIEGFGYRCEEVWILPSGKPPETGPCITLITRFQKGGPFLPCRKFRGLAPRSKYVKTHASKGALKSVWGAT
jgi:hypothetical protein